MNENMVPVPPGKEGAGMGNTADPVVKAGKAIKGFGSGSADASVRGNESVGSGSTNGKGQIKGFSGGAVKGAKV